MSFLLNAYRFAKRVFTGTFEQISVGWGIRFGIYGALSAGSIQFKNPTIRVTADWSGGGVADYRLCYVNAKRVSDGGWEQVAYQRHDNDDSSDSFDYTVTLTNNVAYNQLQFYFPADGGAGENYYSCNVWISQYTEV